MSGLGLPGVAMEEVALVRFNVVAHADSGAPGHAGRAGRAHRDTRTVGNGWERDPYGGELEAARIWGDGVTAEALEPYQQAESV